MTISNDSPDGITDGLTYLAQHSDDYTVVFDYHTLYYAGKSAMDKGCNVCILYYCMYDPSIAGMHLEGDDFPGREGTWHHVIFTFVAASIEVVEWHRIVFCHELGHYAGIGYESSCHNAIMYGVPTTEPINWYTAEMFMNSLNNDKERDCFLGRLPNGESWNPNWIPEDEE